MTKEENQLIEKRPGKDRNFGIHRKDSKIVIINIINFFKDVEEKQVEMEL